LSNCNGWKRNCVRADCLEKQFGRRPVIFYSNGYEHWLWDDANYPPREVQGFFKKAELELLIIEAVPLFQQYSDLQCGDWPALHPFQPPTGP